MQFKPALLGLALAMTLPACTIDLTVNDQQWVGSDLSEEDRILSVLTSQQAAWNAGDIDGFMEGYWVSPDLRFASGGTVTYGWQATRDRYHANYADRSIMGTLEFSNLEVVLIDDDAAIVHGAWALARADDRPAGLFTLVLKDLDGDWKIVSDTTTSAD